jgi:hypothetical protein
MEQGRWDLCCCVQDEEVQVDAWRRSRTQGRGRKRRRTSKRRSSTNSPTPALPPHHRPRPLGSTPPPPLLVHVSLRSESYPQRFLPFLFHPFVRLLVLLLLPFAFCWLLYYGLTHLQLGLDQSTAVPDDSYLKAYFAFEATFLDVGPPVFFVVRQPDAVSASASSSRTTTARSVPGPAQSCGMAWWPRWNDATMRCIALK